MSLLNKASLIQIPSGYKDGTLYSAKPTNGDGDFTFSRGSNLAATRVNSDGLIEKGRENLLLQSNSFDTTWAKSVTATLTSGQTGYDGSSNAWLFGKDATGFINLNQAISSLTGVGTLSIYAKANTNSNIIVRCIGGTDAQGFFDLSNGTLAAPSANCIDTNIEDVGNGWYRCSITFNTSSTTSVNLYPDYPFGGTNAGNIYIQDAQLESGLVATDYIETGASTAQAGILEDMPRLDYSGGASCPALLLEMQRTNLIAQSEYLLGSFTTDNVSLTHNYGTSPDGGNNSVLITQTGTSASNSIYNFGLPTTDGSYTYSFFFRAGTSTSCRFYVATGILEDFNPQTITAGYSGGALNILFEDYGNGWWRASATQTLSSAPFNRFILYPDRNNSGQNVEVYGFQVEQNASYPTSYIPTYGASVTRSADSCYKTGISSLIGQTEGTLFFEFEEDGNTNYSIARGFSISDGTYNNRVYLSRLSSGAIYVAGSVSGSSVIELQEPSPSSRTKVKAALAYANNDYVLYVNGSQKATDTAAGVPSCSNIYLGQEIGLDTNSLKKPYNQVLLFKTRLTNDELAALTTI